MPKKTLCAMIDCSRNAVMTVDALKTFLPILAKMGYNAVMLYTEDTYEIPEYPFFGYMRGRYSQAELREIDEFARGIGIEMIPCIQVLAHLEMALKWDFLPKESKDILLPDDEKCYEFIDRAFASCAECFSSRRIHVGLDEAFGLGTGELLKKNGYERSTPIIKRHLTRVSEIAKKYGFEFLLWSDMFFSEMNDGTYHAMEKKQMPKEIIDAIPEGAVPVYWNYYSMDYNRYDAMLYNHKQMNEGCWFAGGIWGWRGMIPYNQFTINTMTPALDACEKNGTENIMMCIWGDDGNECSRYSHLPSLYYVAQYAKGERDIEKIKAGFEEMFGVPFDTYMYIDEPNRPGNELFGKADMNPSKFMLYSDYFNAFKDCYAVEGAGEEYKSIAAKLADISKKVPPYASFAFESAAKLCEVLVQKYSLGLKTRRAYKAGDKAELLRLVKEEYTALLTLIPEYLDAFSAQWHNENKPSGFDVQDIRLGGLIQRTKSCMKRLEDYAQGRLDSIPELEEEVLEIINKPFGKWRSGAYLFTPNVFAQI